MDTMDSTLPTVTTPLAPMPDGMHGVQHKLLQLLRIQITPLLIQEVVQPQSVRLFQELPLLQQVMDIYVFKQVAAMLQIMAQAGTPQDHL